MLMRFICRIKGHDPEPVRLVDPFFIIPGDGIFTHYKADPNGDEQGCRRCRQVPLKR